MSHMTGWRSVHCCDLFWPLYKAFDHVLHSLLLFSFHKIGTTGLLHRWFKDYLSGRKQCVVLNRQTSSPQDVSSDVPKDFILGPLLFTIYMNDLFKVPLTKGTKLGLNTDDIVLYNQLTAARHLCYFYVDQDEWPHHQSKKDKISCYFKIT